MGTKRHIVKQRSPTRLSGSLYGRVCRILESARASAARSVNTAQVVANWMVGREIVEEEQQGLTRAGYAERIVALLSERLGADYGTGYSAQNLAYMKQFYVLYPKLIGDRQIFHALRGKSTESLHKRKKKMLSGILERQLSGRT